MDLESTHESLRAYRQSDPEFERAIEGYVDAEAALKEDPAEGERAETSQEDGGGAGAAASSALSAAQEG